MSVGAMNASAIKEHAAAMIYDRPAYLEADQLNTHFVST